MLICEDENQPGSFIINIFLKTKILKIYFVKMRRTVTRITQQAHVSNTK